MLTLYIPERRRPIDPPQVHREIKDGRDARKRAHRPTEGASLIAAVLYCAALVVVLALVARALFGGESFENGRGGEGPAPHLVGERNLHGASRETREGTGKEQHQADERLVRCVGRRNLFRQTRSQEVGGVRTGLGLGGASAHGRFWWRADPERRAYRLGPHSGVAGIKPGRPFSKLSCGRPA